MNEISLKELIAKTYGLFNYLISKWIIIVVFGILSSVLGLFYTYTKKTIYTAEITFVVEGARQTGLAGNYAGLASQLGIDMGSSGGGAFEGQNLFALMKSRIIIEKTLLTSVPFEGKQITLAEYYIKIKKIREKWLEDDSALQNIHFLPGADPAKFTLIQNSLITGFHGALVGNNLTVASKDKKSNIMSISVTSEDEMFSKYFAEVLAKQVSEFYIETKVKNIRSNVETLKFQVDSVRREYNAALAGAASSVDANPNVNPSRRNILQVPFQKRQVDAQANQAMLIQLIQSLTIAQNSLREQMPLIQIIDTPILPLPREDFSKLKGVITGGILGGILIVFLLCLRFFFKNIME